MPLLLLPKILSFVKRYWWIPCGVVGLLVSVVFFRPWADSLLRAMTRAQELRKSDLDAIAKAYAQRDAEKKKADEAYAKQVEKTKADHDAALKIIEDEKKAREEELKKLDQEELTKKLSELGNLDVVQLNDEEK